MPEKKILLAMPCAHSIVKMGAMKTMTEVSVALANAGFAVGLATVSVSDLVLARNYLASVALRDGCSHIFFVDSDMCFPGDVVLRLLNADKDVSGLIYTRRMLDLDDVVRLAREKPDATHGEVISKALDFVVRLPTEATFNSGFAEVEGLGMGGTLIKTSALQIMVDKGMAEPRGMPVALTKTALNLYGFFDLWITPQGERLSEDYSFCFRWRECGGTVWGLDTGQVEHVGDFTYIGSLRERTSY